MGPAPWPRPYAAGGRLAQLRRGVQLMFMCVTAWLGGVLYLICNGIELGLDPTLTTYALHSN